MTESQKMTEVFAVITPKSGGEPTTFRVTIREEQLRDVMAHYSYGEEIFDSFKKLACSLLELDADACVIGLAIPKVTELNDVESRKRLGMYTADITNGSFLLH